MVGHPAAFEIIGRAVVSENVHEEFTRGSEGVGHFLEKEFVILHVFEKFD